MFVKQTPVKGADFTVISSTFGHHLPTAPRGGDLWIAYPKASGGVDLRNLTREAGLGTVGGVPGGEPLPSRHSPGAIAVRDPSIDWDGQRALVSLLVGVGDDKRWQIYEVRGLARGAPVTFTRLAQPAEYNNIAPVAGLADEVFFVSDIPRPGPGAQHRHLHPLLDEYEEKPSPTGIWRLQRSSGAVALMHHAPSGAFRPSIDSFGRLVFTNWDHLQRDQQAPGGGVFNFRSEAADAVKEPVQGANTQIHEVFPEPRFTSDAVIYQHEFNLFLPWMMNLDGTGTETLNHIGRQELGVYGAMSRKGVGLSEQVGARGVNAGLANQGIKLGAFHFLREDPCKPGSFYAVRALEFGQHGAGSIVTIDGHPARRPHEMAVTFVTPADTGSALYRSPLPLAECSSGARSLIASASTVTAMGTSSTPNLQYDFRLYRLTAQGASHGIASRITLTPGEKGLSRTLDGAVVNLWEFDPVEVRARVRPAATAMEPVPAPEQSVFAAAGVPIEALRAFLREHELALISVRDTTRRDAFDTAQPFNLEVRAADGGSGVASIKPGSTAPRFMVDHLQIFQADQLRGVDNHPGRRVLAQPMSPLLVDGKPLNPPTAANAPQGAMRVQAQDGSVAAIVPARRALTWQLIDSQNPGDGKRGTDGIVRERFHISFQPGEVRVCANCHGVSDKDQTGATHDAITNPPLALRQLLEHLKRNFDLASPGAAAPGAAR
jgi:mono/diheme cytochrome c family protein